uniref:Serine carboxypeptidase-like 51 n=1 Tax=Rhizophora mucronata TaxID=61149 RepID=A0A2P2KR52_RHIMU
MAATKVEQPGACLKGIIYYKTAIIIIIVIILFPNFNEWSMLKLQKWMVKNGVGFSYHKIFWGDPTITQSHSCTNRRVIFGVT